jgi:hypothetical protein
MDDGIPPDDPSVNTQGRKYPRLADVAVFFRQILEYRAIRIYVLSPCFRISGGN